ncbi:hypothetical protein [Rhizobium sp. NZLR1]|uniref:hypothetical protein n=1 Tax=Rhizobium sp. NZLR1 TaxID=2731096 RepID=UPI001A982B96|nr:hypothetical protein [Rhizobium sp. NZLR1]MBX5202237.1 hypothetical protein [Rhizobium sp. NZLR1]QSZ20849.1 hypothetical protein J3O30_21580 [Rhizobium sp. NZLR1]
MTEKPTPSALRAALLLGGRAKMAKPADAGIRGKRAHEREPDRSAMWSKAIRPSQAACAIASPSATPVVAVTPVNVARRAAPVDRNAMWAKAIKDAQSLPPLDFEPD